MRKIITVLAVIVLFASCGKHHTWTIIQKWHRGTPICEFHYEYGIDWRSFDDSCNKYNIGDTIKHF